MSHDTPQTTEDRRRAMCRRAAEELHEMMKNRPAIPQTTRQPTPDYIRLGPRVAAAEVWFMQNMDFLPAPAEVADLLEAIDRADPAQRDIRIGRSA